MKNINLMNLYLSSNLHDAVKIILEMNYQNQMKSIVIDRTIKNIKKKYSKNIRKKILCKVLEGVLTAKIAV